MAAAGMDSESDSGEEALQAQHPDGGASGQAAAESASHGSQDSEDDALERMMQAASISQPAGSLGSQVSRPCTSLMHA